MKKRLAKKLRSNAAGIAESVRVAAMTDLERWHTLRAIPPAERTPAETDELRALARALTPDPPEADPVLDALRALRRDLEATR